MKYYELHWNSDFDYREDVARFASREEAEAFIAPFNEANSPALALHYRRIDYDFQVSGFDIYERDDGNTPPITAAMPKWWLKKEKSYAKEPDRNWVDQAFPDGDESFELADSDWEAIVYGTTLEDAIAKFEAHFGVPFFWDDEEMA